MHNGSVPPGPADVAVPLEVDVSKIRNHVQRPMAAAAAALAAASLLVAAPLAQAAETVESDRIAGDDRYLTAAAIALEAYPDGADDAVVVSGEAFPDALSGSAVAGRLNAPILLTEQDDAPAATLQALDELGVDTVYILGGPSAVSAEAEAELGEGRTTRRIQGKDRYETAAAAAAAVTSAGIGDYEGLKTAFVATGLKFPDALAGGVLAAHGPGDGTVHPILLVHTDVPAATAEAINSLGIEQVVILGGTGAVSAEVQAELEDLTANDAVRWSGTTREATAVEIAQAAIDDFGFAGTDVLLANGYKFPDALAGAPLGALRQAPILLVEQDKLPAPTRTFLEQQSAIIERVVALGGTAVISDATLAAAKDAATSDPSSETGIGAEIFTVTPDSAQNAAPGGTQQYSADVGTRTVDIVLLECDQVTSSGGDDRFQNTNTNRIADGGARGGSAPDTASTPAAIVKVNNGDRRDPRDPRINNDYWRDAKGDSSGQLTFTVEGPGGATGGACIVPVVFVDGNRDAAFNVTPVDPGDANENYGIGGPVVFAPEEHEGGAFEDWEVSSTDKARDAFVACSTALADQLSPRCRTFDYDSNDVFQLEGRPVSMGVFEAALDAEDEVSGTYEPEPAGSSTFDITTNTAA